MHFATLTLEVAHEIMLTTDFHQKFEKNKILHVFSNSYNIPLMEFFRLTFASAYPYTKNHFHNQKTDKPNIYIFFEWYNITLIPKKRFSLRN